MKKAWTRPFAYRWLLPICIGVLGAYVGDWLVSTVPWLNSLEFATRHRAMLFGVPRGKPAPISIITISAETLKGLGLEDSALRVPRAFHARLLQSLRDAGARVVVLDLDFSTGDKRNDPFLLAALRQLGTMRVTLVAIPREEVQVSETDWDYYFQPLPLLQGEKLQGVALGHTLTLDVGDGPGSAVMLEQEARGGPMVPQASLSAVLQYLGEPVSSAHHVREETEVAAGRFSYRLEGNGDVSIRWLDSPDPFDSIEFSRALRLSSDEARRRFSGRIVLVGDTRRGVDLHLSPFGQIHGVWFIANLINTLLLAPRDQIHFTSDAIAMLWSLVLASGVGFATLTGKLGRALALTSLAVALGAFVPCAAAAAWNLQMETVAPLLGCVLAFGIAAFFEVSLAGPRELRQAGHVEDASVLFVDIRDSTGVTRRIGGSGYQKIYSALSSKARRFVDERSGSIERTTGDGFIAVFRGPSNAARCAAAIPGILQAARDSGLEAVAGMESGEISGGYVWESGRRTWSSAGDAVNLAARLQAACPGVGVGALVGPEAAHRLGKAYDLLEHADLRLKGFEDAISAYSFSEDARINK